MSTGQPIAAEDVEKSLPTPDVRSQVPAIGLVDANHRMISVSKPLADLLGYSVAELCNMSFEQITYPPDIDIDADLAERVFHNEIDGYELVKRYRHKDGTLIRALLTVTILRDAKGRITHGVGQVRPLNNTAAKAIPIFQHSGEPNNEIERIKRAMFD